MQMWEAQFDPHCWIQGETRTPVDLPDSDTACKEMDPWRGHVKLILSLVWNPCIWSFVLVVGLTLGPKIEADAVLQRGSFPLRHGLLSEAKMMCACSGDFSAEKSDTEPPFSPAPLFMHWMDVALWMCITKEPSFSVGAIYQIEKDISGQVFVTTMWQVLCLVETRPLGVLCEQNLSGKRRFDSISVWAGLQAEWEDGSPVMSLLVVLRLEIHSCLSLAVVCLPMSPYVRDFLLPPQTVDLYYRMKLEKLILVIGIL